MKTKEKKREEQFIDLTAASLQIGLQQLLMSVPDTSYNTKNPFTRGRDSFCFVRLAETTILITVC